MKLAILLALCFSPVLGAGAVVALLTRDAPPAPPSTTMVFVEQASPPEWGATVAAPYFTGADDVGALSFCDGPLQGLPTLFNTTALGTDPVKVTLPSGGSCVAVKITNPSATATISWKTIVSGGTAPVAANMTADYAATGASPIPPGVTEFIQLQPGRDLYVVASAAATSCNATSFLFN